MSTRKQKITLEVSKQLLRDRGYTYRQAAPVLGVCYQHLCQVLNGQRESLPLIRRISDLPYRTAAPTTAPAAETPVAG